MRPDYHTDHQADRETDHLPPGLTIAHAATVLGVSENAVRQRVKRGTLPAVKVDGLWRITLAGTDYQPDHETDHQAGYQRDDQADYQPGYQATTSAVVSPAARAQLAAVWEELQRPLVDRVAALERENGRLEAERDVLAAEVEILRAVGPQDAPGDAEERRPVSGVTAWWRRLRGRE